MIFDELTNKEQYFCLGEKIKKGFEFLSENDLSSMSDGKYIIDGEDIFANVQTLTTKKVEEKKWEVHRKYIDIQYIIKGEEKMGYGFLGDFSTVTVPYSSEKDVEFLDGKKYNFVDVKENEFVIFYPNDVHAPMLAVNEAKEIKKVIVKIAL